MEHIILTYEKNLTIQFCGGDAVASSSSLPLNTIIKKVFASNALISNFIRFRSPNKLYSVVVYFSYQRDIDFMFDLLLWEQTNEKEGEKNKKSIRSIGKLNAAILH